MRKRIVFGLTIFGLLFLTIACSNNSPNQSSADWAFQFVVFDGYIYKLTDEYVKEVKEQIGEVTKHSDVEGTYSGNFSNTYEKGTEYFSIKGISTNEAIAIKEGDGIYRKAINDGEYGGK